MKSTLDKLDGLSRKLNIEIPAEKVQQAFDRVYKGIQKNATIKGFRKGKAPMATLRTMYGDQARNDVAQDLVQNAYQSALEEHKLEPIGYPKIHFDELAETTPFHFTAEFEIRPEVDLKNYENLAVQKEKLEIGDDRINTILENIRSSQSETVTVFEDRALAQGDVAEIDFAGSINGQPLPNGEAEKHLLEIGSHQFIEGFEEGLIGMKAGDKRQVHLRFPEGYHEKSLSGQPVTFDVTLRTIKKKELPELSDELAKKVGPYENLEQLKEAIRKDIEESETRRIKEELKNRLIRKLVEANPMQVPKGLIAEQKAALIEDFRGRLNQQGMGEKEFEEYKVKWNNDFEQSAAFMVHSTFLLDALAEKLNLSAAANEIEAKIAQFAQQTGLEIEKVRDFYRTPERRSRLAFQITEEKVIDQLLDKANVTEVPHSELEDHDHNHDHDHHDHSH